MMIQVLTKSLIELQVNGEVRSVLARPSDTLLHVLREQLGLTGAKIGCETGDCDTCTVLLDGWPVKACLTLAVEGIGRAITTIEGLTNTPIQQAFLDKEAFQCGYCTSGFIMNAHALTQHHPDANEEVIAEWLGSNLCRCTSYQEIQEAVQMALVVGGKKM